jgi:hypothetical protein
MLKDTFPSACILSEIEAFGGEAVCRIRVDLVI